MKRTRSELTLTYIHLNKNLNIIVTIQEHKINCKIDCKNLKNIKQLSDTCPKNKPHQLEKT